VLAFVVPALISALVAFALVPLTLYGVGWRLSRDHVATRSAVVSAPIDAVFAVLADVALHPRWRKRVARVQIIARAPRLRFRQKGRDGTLELEVAESQAPSRFVLATVPGRRAIFTGTWTFELSAEGDATRVTLTERGEIASPIARVFAEYLLGHATNVERTLGDLGAHFRTAT
jgi:hypothetical protein